MRLQGKITRWEDDRGFGFISWNGDGSTVFVHIKAFPNGSRRPKLGDVVTYELVDGKDGKSRAEKARFSGRSAESPKKANKLRGQRKEGALPVIFTLLFIAFVVVAAYLDRLPWMLLAVYLIASLITYITYAWDKSAAKQGKWRTEEFTLHLMALLGGWPGGLLAQRILRHKSSKQEFLIGFWFTVLLNTVAVGYLAFTGDLSLRIQ